MGVYPTGRESVSESTDRNLAADVANAVAGFTYTKRAELQLKPREASSWLSAGWMILKANWRRHSQALQAFRDREQILDVAGGPGLERAGVERAERAPG